MKILLVMDCHTDFINGMTQSVLHLFCGLSALGHDVRILMPSPDRHASMDEGAFLAPSFGCSFVYPGFRVPFRLTGNIRKTILDWRPDVVHTNTEGLLFFRAKRICRETGAVHVHTFHTNYLDFYNQYLHLGERASKAVMLSYGRLCFRKLDGIISPSLWGKQIMDVFRLSAPHFILPNGISTEKFAEDHAAERAEIRRRYGVSDSDCLLLFTGRTAAEKNIPELLEHFAKLEDPSVKLMIAGGGPVLDALKQQAASMDVRDRILFTGMVPAESIHTFYAAADIFVTASRSEVQPLTYVEAMASGLPVVCADAAYIEGLVMDGETGYAFHSADEFTKYIRLLAEDPDFRRTTGEKARSRVLEDYSIAAFAQRCMNIYAQVRAAAS